MYNEYSMLLQHKKHGKNLSVRIRKVNTVLDSSMCFMMGVWIVNSIKIEKGAVEAIKKTIRLHDKMDELLQEMIKALHGMETSIFITTLTWKQNIYNIEYPHK